MGDNLSGVFFNTNLQLLFHPMEAQCDIIPLERGKKIIKKMNPGKNKKC